MSHPDVEAHALVLEARRCYERNDVTGAIMACRRAVALGPDLPHVHAELGDVLSRRHDYWINPDLCQRLIDSGELDEAIRCFRTSLDLGQRSSWTSFNLGHALSAKGEYGQAVPFLRQAADLKIREERPEHHATYGDSGIVDGPHFLIIGGTKCGTTSMYEYMSRHPHILPAVWKEIEYFRFPERGRDWYLSHFPRIPPNGPRFITGEASTCYMSLFTAKTLVRAEVPDVRLLALLRDPVDKVISHYHHDRKIGCEFRALDVALSRELDILESLNDPWNDARDYWKTERGYVWLSLYVYFLENWLSVFPPQQLLILLSEDLYARPRETMTRVYDFLGLPDHQLAQYDVHLKGRYERKDDPIQARLRRFFAPHNARLERLLRRELPWQRP